MAITFVRTSLLGGPASPLNDVITPDAGNCVVMKYNFQTTGSCVVATVTDSQSNNWQQAVASVGDGTGLFSEIWYALNVKAGFTVVTTTLTATGLVEALDRQSEYSGVATVYSAVDATNSHVNTATLAHTVGAITPTREVILVGGICYRPAGGSPSLDAGNGYTQFGANPDTGGGGILCLSAYKDIASGAQESSWTLGAVATGVGMQVSLHGPLVSVPTIILPRRMHSRRTSW